MGVRGSVRAVGLAVLVATVAAVFPTPAGAEVKSVFDGRVPCAEQSGVRFCEGSIPNRVPSWDGVPLDANVVLPPPSMGDGPFPVIERLHGFGAFKTGNDTFAQEYAKAGYAVLSHTARGFYNSCGNAASRAADPAGCARGWSHLADVRYEVRDSQHLQGLLVDDGVVQPRRIGVTGESYGGGRSSLLAVLRNRVVLPDGRYAPFRSPKGVPMEIAAAAPQIPFSDLSTILAPNGRGLDYLAESPYLGSRGDAPVGVLKQGFVPLLFGLLAANYFAPPGADPEADVAVWLAGFEQGEPYEEDERDVVGLFTRYRSAAFRVDGLRPAPLLLYSAVSDDLTTTLESVRLANRVLGLHPRAEVSLFFADAFGHPRASLVAPTPNLPQRMRAFFDRNLKSVGNGIANGVELYRQSCDGSAVGPPITAPSWQEVRRGEVRAQRAGEQTGGVRGRRSRGVGRGRSAGGRQLPLRAGRLGGSGHGVRADPPGAQRLHAGRLPDGDRTGQHPGGGNRAAAEPALGRGAGRIAHAHHARHVPPERHRPPGVPASDQRVAGGSRSLRAA